MSQRKIILLDCGDTLVDEATEIKDESGATVHAELIPGAQSLVHALVANGYTLALVADGPVATFRNVLGHFGLWECFSTFSISETVGVEKPHPLMFTTALDTLGVAPAEYGNVVMVGNNLERDIAGANALGLISVWLSWSPRRSDVPKNELEVPVYSMDHPIELVKIAGRIWRV